MWAGIFFKAQALVSEKSACLRGNEILENRLVDQNLQIISHSLLADFTLRDLTDTLEKGMESLKIRNCFIFATNAIMVDNDEEASIFDKCLLIFKYRDGKREEVPSTVAGLRKQLSDLLCENKENVLLAYLLHVTDEILGFALFSYGQPDISIYQTLSIHISAAISRIILLKGLTQYTKACRACPEGGYGGYCDRHPA